MCVNTQFKCILRTRLQNRDTLKSRLDRMEINGGSTVVQRSAMSPLGSNRPVGQLSPFCVEFASSVLAPASSHSPKTCIGVYMSGNGSLSLCVSPVIDY